jgi:hypothetical protein
LSKPTSGLDDLDYGVNDVIAPCRKGPHREGIELVGGCMDAVRTTAIVDITTILGNARSSPSTPSGPLSRCWIFTEPHLRRPWAHS